MDNGVYLLALLVLIIMLGTSLGLLAASWNMLVVTLPATSTPMILVYTALAISYVVISLMFLQLIVGFILFMIGYGKTDSSLTKYLVSEYGYSEQEAASLVSKAGNDGIKFFNNTMIKDVDNANSLVLRFKGAGEVFKSVSIILYVFSLALIFVLGVSAAATIDRNKLTNNGGYGLLLSSISISAVSIIILTIAYIFMVKKSKTRRELLTNDKERLQVFIGKK